MTSPAFDEALDALYHAFSGPRPRVIEGCPCCLDTRKTDVLLARPLGALSGQDLARYASGLFLTVGGAVDFRYFLPRLFELSARDPGWHPSPEIVIGKLRLAAWDGWPLREREAVSRFLDAWFEAEIAAALAYAEAYGVGAGDRVDSLICGLARASGEVAPWLERLLRPETAPLLRDFMAYNRDGATGGPALANAFWDGCEDAGRPVLAFLERLPASGDNR